MTDEAVDLIVTDVGLAGVIYGHRLAKVARAMRPRLKVLFITGQADGAESAASTWCAGIEILPKPSQVKALADTQILWPMMGERHVFHSRDRQNRAR